MGPDCGWGFTSLAFIAFLWLIKPRVWLDAYFLTIWCRLSRCQHSCQVGSEIPLPQRYLVNPTPSDDFLPMNSLSMCTAAVLAL